MRLIGAGVVLGKLSGRLESMKDYDAIKIEFERCEKPEGV